MPQEAPNTAIISSGRCGSTLLCQSLGRHPQIREAGEPLNHNARGFADFHPWLRDTFGVTFGADETLPYASQKRRLISNPIYLEHVLATKNLIKLHYWHLLPYPELSGYLVGTDVRVIHLARRRLVDTYVSFEFHGRYTYRKKLPRDFVYPNCLLIDLQKMEDFLVRAYQSEQQVEAMFSGRTLRVWYEDLIADWDVQISRILAFSGYDDRNVPQAKVRVIPIPHLELCANREEVEARVAALLDQGRIR